LVTKKWGTGWPKKGKNNSKFPEEKHRREHGGRGKYKKRQRSGKERQK